MNKRDLHQIVFDVYGRVLNVSNCYVEEVNLSTLWCLSDNELLYFIELIQEKIPESFSFLKERRFENLQDVCMEIERYYPVEETAVSCSTVKTRFSSNGLFSLSRQRD